MGFPSKKEINRVLKKLENVEGTLTFDKNSGPLEHFRHEIQQKIVGFFLDNNLTQTQLAEFLGIDEPKVSKILRNRLDGFSTDRLMKLYQKLDPNVRYKVS